MFYGLTNFLKKILPKRLFYRALLIVAIPVLVLQLVITIVFFDSLWIKTNKGMTRTLANEISTFVEAYENEQSKKQELIDLFSLFLDSYFSIFLSYLSRTSSFDKLSMVLEIISACSPSMVPSMTLS